MSSTSLKKRNLLKLQNMDIWASPEMSGLPEDVRTEFQKRKAALELYVQGAPFEEIKKKCGISRQFLFYLIDRCSQVDENGAVVGLYGLIKYKHVGPRVNSTFKLDAGTPLPGSLSALFCKYPTLKQIMIKAITEGLVPGSRASNRHLTWCQIHETFKSECTKLGIKPPMYPFCSDSNGKAALVRWGKAILSNKPILCHATTHLKKGSPIQAYQRMELDGHFLDVNWKVEVPSANGQSIIHCKVSRLWIICLLECTSTAVTGYSVSLGRNYNAADVARAIRSSVVPWEPRQLSVSTIAYKPGEGLPNALHPDLSYICFDELWLDNAKSHLSSICLNVLQRDINAVPVFGPKASPNARPRIEQLFDLLEEAGIHCMPGTTGANPKDPRKTDIRKSPYVLKLDTLLDLIDILIGRYNTGICPGSTLSRNEVLLRVVTQSTHVLRRVPVKHRESCLKYCIYDEAIVGKDKSLPVIRWKNARYSGPGLNRASQIGERVLIMANEDCREIEAIIQSTGESLGKLIVEKRWRNTPHSIATRAAIRRAMTNSNFLAHAADIPLAFTAHMEKDVVENKRNMRTLARLHAEQTASQPIKPNNIRTEPLKVVEDVSRITESLSETESSSDLDELINRMGTVYR